MAETNAIFLLDACAILAYLQEERGAGYEEVAGRLPKCAVLSVNEAEAIRKLTTSNYGRSLGITVEKAAEMVHGLPVQRLPFVSEMAPVVAAVQASGKNISLADGACISAAHHHRLTVLTKDAAMAVLVERWCDVVDIFPNRPATLSNRRTS